MGPASQATQPANGEGVPQDDAEAVRWYRLAAEQSYPMAQNNLGIMYAIGEGLPQDKVQAYTWTSIAAAQGNANAQRHKELLVKDMTRPQIDEAQKLSREYRSRYVVPFQ